MPYPRTASAVTGASQQAAVITAARHRFFDSGDSPQDLLSPAILRSWQRCAALGLNGTSRPRSEALTLRELSELSERHDSLLNTSRPEMATLHSDAVATDSIIILTDPTGVVLDSMGSAQFAGEAAEVALRPGMAWNESRNGTNAIGTAIAEREAISVHGGEHFFAPHGILQCAAVPIFGPTGEIAGVLDMSGHAAADHAHALGLVQLAVDHIEQRLFEHGFPHCQTIRFHRDPRLLGTAREGILVFQDNRLIAANRHGLALVGSDWQAIDRAHYHDLFANNVATLKDHGQLQTHDGGRLVCRSPTAPQRVPVHRPAPTFPTPRRPIPATNIPPIFDDRTSLALSRAVRLLDADVPVLVQGETGTGKEVFARAVHAGSQRRHKPFVAVNCAAFPESLIEAELFGYEPGAFTGARRDGSKGWLREADGGVLFLDEIGDMPLALQSRLLRVLQEREVVPVGGRRAIPVDFTLICATNRPLADMITSGSFRPDLYFRIAQYTVELPTLRTLRNRAGLIDEAWQRLTSEITLSSDCRRALADYSWPGNFRQLVATLRALAVLAEPGMPVDVCDLPDAFQSPQSHPIAPTKNHDETPTHLADITRDALQQALTAHHGNVSRAAKHLGISRSTLYRRLGHTP